MEVGSCFLTYDDFIESFMVFKEKNKNHYCIQKSESVRLYNAKNEANIRRDVMFIEAKFGCLSVDRDRHKGEPPENTCPAYFILRYDKKLDHLVITEVDDNHVHSKEKDLSPSSRTPPTETSALSATCLDTPSNNAPGKVLQSDARSDHGTTLQEPVQNAVPPQKESPPKFKSNIPSFNDDPESQPVEISEDAVKRIAALMQNFLFSDMGAKATITIGTQQELEQLCFQTSKMGEQFLKFPETLLIHRVYVKYGYVLYAFLVETKERVGKIVHFSFIRSDNPQSISRIISIFQDFNPEWNKVKIIFTDVGFSHNAMFKDAFPSAQTLLSVYHTVNFIQKNVKGKPPFKEWLHRLIEDAVFSTSPAKLSFLSEKIQSKLDATVFDYLCTNWFSCELLWYTHTKKGLHSCSTYMDSLDMVLGKISRLLNNQSSMESVIQKFVENADCFNSKGLENQKDCAFRCSSKNKTWTPPPPRKKKKTTNQPKLDFSPSAHHSISFGSFNARSIAPKSKLSPVRAAQNRANGLDTTTGIPPLVPSATSPCADGPDLSEVSPTNPTDSDSIYLFLKEHCSELGFSLCLKEWEIVQKSTQVINVRGKAIGVQVLEEFHRVSVDGRSCTCYFNVRYKLPCRHILSMLYRQKRPVERAMVSSSMQKNTQTCDTGVPGSEDKPTERAVKTSCLTKELSNLLHQCKGPEQMVRCSTLQMLVDMWSKETSSGGTESYSESSSAQPLPYKWVKKEDLEGEESSDRHELCRLDAQPSLS